MTAPDPKWTWAATVGRMDFSRRMVILASLCSLQAPLAGMASGQALSDAASQPTFIWERSSESVQHLYQQIRLLRFGANYALVKDALGAPSRDKVLMSKDGKRKQKALQYDIKRLWADDGNLRDQVISLYFGEDDGLDQIYYLNLSPLSGTVIDTFDGGDWKLVRTVPPVE